MGDCEVAVGLDGLKDAEVGEHTGEDRPKRKYTQVCERFLCEKKYY